MHGSLSGYENPFFELRYEHQAFFKIYRGKSYMVIMGGWLSVALLIFDVVRRSDARDVNVGKAPYQMLIRPPALNDVCTMLTNFNVKSDKMNV